ncbi:hypothetical protein JQ569_13830 [Bradyrhizobium elkanii]|nr:hypothetical protein [Bradyrhizobium elkanii]
MSGEVKPKVPTNVRSTVDRLRRVEAWRRTRLGQLLAAPEINRAKRIHAARLYLEVVTRRMAAERGLLDSGLIGCPLRDQMAT